MIMPPCDNGTRAGLRPVPFGLPGSIPGGGVFCNQTRCEITLLIKKGPRLDRAGA